jgi:hypothetical protein
MRKKYATTYYQRNRERVIAQTRLWQEKNQEKFIEYQNEYRIRTRDQRLKKMKIYRDKNKDKIRIYYHDWYTNNGRNRRFDYQEAILEWKQKFPERIQAMQKLNYALKTGRIIRPVHCQSCNRMTRIHGHHIDYNKPFNVEWLCASCHKLKHSIR